MIKMTPVSGIEREPWDVACILIRVNDGVFIYTCNVKSNEYNCWKNIHLLMAVISNLCINRNVVGISLIIELMHLFVFWGGKTERQRKN